MKVLIVTNMYPGRNESRPQQGIFVQEQMNSLIKDHHVDCKLFVIDGFKSKLNYLTSGLKLNWHLLFNRYDAIHVHYALSGVFMLLNPLRSWRNVVVTCHGQDIQAQDGKEGKDHLVNRLSKKVLKRVGGVITLNDNMDAIVAPINANITRMPCGVETDFFNPNQDKLEHVIVFPGGMNNGVKNYPLFAAVMNEYQKIEPNAKIAMMDNMSRAQIKHTLETATALLMTSLSEGSPQSVKEALSCDLAVVCTNVGDVADIFAEVKGTAIVELEDSAQHIAQQLHQCVEAAKTSAGQRRERLLSMGFAQKDVTGRLLKLFKQVA
ncbi:MAG: teichuronic acid biosynthesis glycosyltransferase TuaC [Phenylobacterium sp.]|jgi:teichuronic acid biosynthesis glycosyltransferase TuaC